MRAFLMASLVAVLAAGSCPDAATAEAGHDTVVAVTSYPDLARTRARFAKGPFGQIWALPALASARKLIDEQVATLKTTQGFDLWALLADVTAIEHVVVADAAGNIHTQVAGRFPGQIAGLMQVLTTRGEQRADALMIGDQCVARDGDWLLVGDRAPTPGVRATGAPAGDHDSWFRCDLAALAATAPNEAKAVLAALGLDSLQARNWLTDNGSRELLELPGFQAPFAPVEVAAFAGLPADTLLVAAVGLDGARVQALVNSLAKASPACAHALDGFDRQLAGQGLPALAAILKTLAGTAWLSVTNGAPFPALTLALPATPEIDACVEALAQAAQFDVAAARSGALMLPLKQGMPVSVLIRRTASHWLLSSDAGLIDQLATGKPGGFTVPRAAAEQALGIYVQDTKSTFQLLVNYLPLLRTALRANLAQAYQLNDDGEAKARLKQFDDIFTAVQQGMMAALPYLKPGYGRLTRDAQGSVISGENLSLAVMPESFLAGMMLPAIGMVRQMAQRQKSGKNLSQICGASIAYDSEEGKMPPDLASLAKKEQLPKALFVCPTNPALADPYLYIRPIEDPPSDQPLLMEDPSCNRGKGSMVCFGDSHVAFIKAPNAQRLWQEAQRLSRLPKAQTDGIALDDWKAVGDILGLDPADPPAGATPAP